MVGVVPDAEAGERRGCDRPQPGAGPASRADTRRADPARPGGEEAGRGRGTEGGRGAAGEGEGGGGAAAASGALGPAWWGPQGRTPGDGGAGDEEIRKTKPNLDEPRLTGS